jgi:murein L,D-transpeptidase YcbB/YkuD
MFKIFSDMRTITKLFTSNKPFSSILSKVFFLLIVFHNPPIDAISANSTLSNDASYSTYTVDIIKRSLKDCQNKVVWLEGIELLSAPLICTFYQENNFKPVWTNGNELTPQSLAVLELFKNSYRYGFDPVNFDISTLEKYSKCLAKGSSGKKSAHVRVSFEFLMTNSVFSFMSHLARGTEFSNAKDVFISGDQFLESLPGLLNEFVTSDQIVDEILKLQPSDSKYSLSQSEMEEIVRDMVETKSTLTFPEAQTESYACLFSYLFRRAGITTEETNVSDKNTFVPRLIQFQNTIGLRPTGKVDSSTKRAITNILWDRYTELSNTLEKIRHTNNKTKDSILSKS